MNTIKMAITLLLLSWHTCWAATPLGDIDVKLEVTAQPRIEIEKPHGGWYENIKLHNSPENHAVYEVKAPVAVKLRRQEGYKISIKNPLILTRQSDAFSAIEQTFSPAEVRWGNTRTNLRLLSAVPESFSAPPQATRHTTTDYVLQISAKAPAGDNTAGKYHGQLTLVFEVNS
ncbi:fimbrial protein [Yersinia pestis subsp. microtus bv. Caucasica]|uniref:fimbrial protein n=1 Tax=Yersinia pestis TaxID=632 RepID=UPI0009763C01|nr:fimbrial protein [Yersinia pestis]OMK89834.1 fimbrial protein [Yersinia pestis subsp. microtus bv. Caucasica]